MKSGEQRSIHVSWHIATMATGILLGVAASAIWPAMLLAGAGWPVLAAGVSLLLIRRSGRRALLIALAAGMIVGLWRGSLEQTARQAYAPHYGRTVTAKGSVTEDTAYGKKGDLAHADLAV